MGLEGFDGVFFDGFRFRETLAIVKVDEIGGPVVLTSLLAFGAIPSEVSYFSALKACIRRVSRGGCIALEVALGSISLVVIRVLSSTEVVSSVIPSVIPSGWCPVPVYVHRDRGVIHPSGRVR